MCVDTCIIQILNKIEEEPILFELVTTKINRVLHTKYQARAFIALVQTIEDRIDPQSKYHNYSIDEILDFHGFPRSTYYRKWKRYRELGYEALIPRKRGPKDGRLPSQIKYRIEELRELQQSAKSISCIVSVESQRNLSESTVQYHLKKIGKPRLKRNKKPKKTIYKRFERSKPNELWQIDNVGPFYKPNKLFAYNVVDDHSRYSLAVQIADNQRSDSWIILLEKLIAKYGKPDAILHDNGSQYVAPSSGRLTRKFKAFLDKHGIKSIRSRLRHPETCGKVERFQQSFQHQSRDLVYTNSISELQESVDAWREFYNKVRIHSTTKEVPHKRYFKQEPSDAAKLSACQIYEHTLIKFSGG